MYENAVFIEIDMIVECRVASFVITLPHQIYVFLQDMCSYENECVKGHEACNFFSIVMHERSVDLIDQSGVKFRKISDRFMAAKAYLPLWAEPPDSDVVTFVDALGI